MFAANSDAEIRLNRNAPMTKPHLNKVAVIFIAGKCLILHLTETINVDFKLLQQSTVKNRLPPPLKALPRHKNSFAFMFTLLETCFAFSSSPSELRHVLWDCLISRLRA